MASILVIEDDDDLRSTIKRMLQMHGHVVLDAQHGEQGTLLFKESLVDLVITDIFMPIKEGIMMIIDLKKMSPDVRIIAISGGVRKGDVDYLKFSEKLGVDRTFKKPVDADELLDAVNQLLTA